MRARVLVVDDDVAVRTLLSVVLDDDSWDVVVAGTVEEALALVHDGGITVVVLDRHLVDADGIELLEDLGQASETGTIPVILISARAEPIPAPSGRVGAAWPRSDPSGPEGRQACRR